MKKEFRFFASKEEAGKVVSVLQAAGLNGIAEAIASQSHENFCPSCTEGEEVSG